MWGVFSEMNKKVLITMGILVITIILISVYIRQPTVPTEEQLSKRFSEFKIQYDEKKAQGYDVTEAEEFARKAKQAFDKKDYRTANKLLESAFEALEKATISVAPVKPIKVETNCIDGIDNDGDGLIDNGDGDCWIREGPIYETHPYYYDGTFKGLIKKIPEIADLGVKTIYLMPIWKQKTLEEKDPRYFLYHVDDYFQINPEYGTAEELKELVDTVHKYGMKILFDLTTGTIPPGGCTMSNDNWVFRIPLSELKEKAGELGWVLEYTTIDGNDYVYSGCEFNKRLECELFGTILGDEVVLHHYPRHANGWAVNRSNPEVIEYFTKVAEYYIREFDIDGWRIDYPANNYNSDIISGDYSILKLLRSVKKAIVKVKPDAILLAEGPMVERGMNKDWLEKDPVLDELCEASYSYYFYYRLEEVKSSKRLIDILKEERIWHNRQRARLLETHDTQRINEILPQLNKPLIVLISTIPGIPWVQAGQEIGARNSYFFDHQIDPRVDWANGNYELREFYKKVFEIRNNNNALKYGSIENVWKSGDNTYAYLRSYEEDNVVVIINFQNKRVSSILNLPFNSGSTLYDELNNEYFVVNDPSNFKITLPAYGSRILVLEKK